MIRADLLPEVIQFLRLRSVTAEWSLLKEVLQDFNLTETNDWKLPLIVCEAFGEKLEAGIPASASLLCAQSAILLVDDVLDSDDRGLHNRIGAGRASNLALALQSLAFSSLADAEIDHRYRLKAVHSMAEMFLKTSHGQDRDVQKIENEEMYWEVVRLKSTPFYACAMELGGWMAKCEEHASATLSELGTVVGEIVQLHDDLYDALEVPAKPDWSHGSSNLLILYALTVDHPDLDEFSELVDRPSDHDKLSRLHQILISCGAISYCVYQISTRHSLAKKLASEIRAPSLEPISRLVDEQIQPVRTILEKVGTSLPESTDV